MSEKITAPKGAESKKRSWKAKAVVGTGIAAYCLAMLSFAQDIYDTTNTRNYYLDIDSQGTQNDIKAAFDLTCTSGGIRETKIAVKGEALVTPLDGSLIAFNTAAVKVAESVTSEIAQDCDAAKKDVIASGALLEMLIDDVANKYDGLSRWFEIDYSADGRIETFNESIEASIRNGAENIAAPEL